MRFLLSSAALLALVAGCSSGPACVIDTDCLVGFRCGGDGTCHEIGVRMDAGPRDGGARDGTAGDVRASDARADVLTDTGAPDAPVECPAAGGTRPLTMVGVGCTGLTQSTISLTDDGTMTCTFSVTLDTDAVGSAMGGDRPDEVVGSLSIGGTPQTCTLVITATGMEISCDGGCNFSAGPPA